LFVLLWTSLENRRIACAGGGKFRPAGGDSVARTKRPRGDGINALPQRGGPKHWSLSGRQAGAGSIFQRHYTSNVISGVWKGKRMKTCRLGGKIYWQTVGR